MLVWGAAAFVGLSYAQPSMAQSRDGGMRVYQGRGASRAASAAPRGAGRASGPRVYERGFSRRDVGKGRHGAFRGFHHRKPFVFFALPFAYFPFDAWGYAPYPSAMPALPAPPSPGPSKVIDVTRGPTGIELRVRYADDRQATIPVTDSLPQP
jgi:hypothetical protein